ncbi:MAG: asparaginase, partial [Pseudomonadota bacterium]
MAEMLPLNPRDDKARADEANPVLVEIWRGEGVESQHRGAVCVVDARGRVVFAAGDQSRPIFPRSALKPFQALALVETGAADHFRLSDAELALACASHSGHAGAVAVAEAWLQDLELPETALICGPQEPLDLKTAAQLIRDDQAPRRVHNNCSGKHLGFLTACLHRGWDAAGYGSIDHPAQRHWLATLERLAEEKVTNGPQGVDGCGLPAISL